MRQLALLPQLGGLASSSGPSPLSRPAFGPLATRGTSRSSSGKCWAGVWGAQWGPSPPPPPFSGLTARVTALWASQKRKSEKTRREKLPNLHSCILRPFKITGAPFLPPGRARARMPDASKRERTQRNLSAARPPGPCVLFFFTSRIAEVVF